MKDKLEHLVKTAHHITPILMVSDVDKCCEFYKKAFNLEIALKTDNPNNKTDAAFLLHNESRIILRLEGTFDLEEKSPKHSGVNAPISILLSFDDVDAQFERAKNAGAEVLFSPKEMPWGCRTCKLRDPEGYFWYLESVHEKLSFDFFTQGKE